MPISDLTGTTWRFNSSLTSSDDVLVSINFISNETEYTSFWFQMVLHTDLTYDSDRVYRDGTWQNEAYRLISITGGTDVTNASLISLLEANAEQVLPPQLSVDLSTLSGWSNVSSGSHTLKVKAKAAGYQDSALSAGASFTKAG